MSEVNTLPKGSDPVTHDELGTVLVASGIASAASQTELVDRVAAVELNETLNTGGVTQDEIDALTGADTPSSDNVFATIADLPATPPLAAVLAAGADPDGTNIQTAALASFVATAGDVTNYAYLELDSDPDTIVQAALDAKTAAGESTLAVLPTAIYVQADGGSGEIHLEAGTLVVPVGIVILSALPTSDPGVAGQVYSNGTPSAGVPKALMISGGTS